MFMTNYKKTLVAAAIVFALPAAHATSIDMTALNSTGTVNGAIFSNPDNVDVVGSGVFEPFVRVQGNGMSQGFNTDGSVTLDTKAGTWTHSIQLGTIGGDIIGGVSYRTFALDINQAKSKELLSLDALQIYLGNTPSPTGFDPNWASPGDGFDAPGTDAKLVYDLDAGANNEVLMNYALFNGSGLGIDMVVYIPDTLFGGASATDYLYLYSQWGGKGGDYVDNDGFQEWRAKPGEFSPPPEPPEPPEPHVPEPGILSLLGLGLLGLAAKARRKNA
jgi:hypothetical protein